MQLLRRGQRQRQRQGVYNIDGRPRLWSLGSSTTPEHQASKKQCPKALNNIEVNVWVGYDLEHDYGVIRRLMRQILKEIHYYEARRCWVGDRPHVQDSTLGEAADGELVIHLTPCFLTMKASLG